MKRVDKKIKVSTYYKASTDNLIMYATHWIDTETGEVIPLTVGFKAYYKYRLYKFSLMSANDMIYNESHQRVASLIGISFDSIKKTYQPMAVRMGLIQTETDGKKGSASYQVYEANLSCGEWVNYDLHKYVKPRLAAYDRTEPFTFDNLKILEHNKKLAQNIKGNSDNKLYVVSQDEYLEFKRSRINKGDNDIGD